MFAVFPQLWTAGENGNIAAGGNLQHDLIILPDSLVIGFKPFAQPVSADPNNRVESRVIVPITAIDLAADHILIQFKRASGKIGLADQLQKLLLRRRINEMFTG